MPIIGLLKPFNGLLFSITVHCRTSWSGISLHKRIHEIPCNQHNKKYEGQIVKDLEIWLYQHNVRTMTAFSSLFQHMNDYNHTNNSKIQRDHVL